MNELPIKRWETIEAASRDLREIASHLEASVYLPISSATLVCLADLMDEAVQRIKRLCKRLAWPPAIHYEPVTPLPEGTKLEYNMHYETFTGVQLPPDWAIEKALRAGGVTHPSVLHVKQAQSSYDHVLAFARYIAEHERPPAVIPDPGIRAAVRAYLLKTHVAHCEVAEIEEGMDDDSPKARAFIAGANWAMEHR